MQITAKIYNSVLYIYLKKENYLFEMKSKKGKQKANTKR